MENCEFDSASGCLMLSGELTVYQAAAAHRFFVAHCGDGSLRTVDLSDVTEIDSAGLQLLLSLMQTPSKEPVRLVRPSASVCAVFSLLQMDELLHETGELTA